MAAKTTQQIRTELKIGRWMTGYLPVKALRWMQRMTLYRVTLPNGIRTERTIVGGVPCEWFSATDAPDGPAMLYLHGGGFIFGTSYLHRQMVANLTLLTGGRALVPDYRLAPEHPFPAALDDCVAVYDALLGQGIAPERLAVAGDSAGGNLTLGTLLTARDSGRPLPACGICLSPPTDLTSHDEDKWWSTPDAILHPRAVRTFLDAYVAGKDATNPLLSPAFADLRGLPPLLVYAGGDERLRDDIVRLADAAKSQGAPLTLHIAERMWHVYQLFYADLPEAAASLQESADFVKQHTAQLAPVHA